MNGRQAVASHRQRIDSAFGRATRCGSDTELLADFSRYLCILVAGFVEKSLSEIVLEHARQQGSPSLQKFVESKTSKFTNANSERILQLLASFDSEWRSSMESYLVDEKKDAIDSIYSNRNTIAHGGTVGLSFVRISDYYREAKMVIKRVEEICLS